MKSAQVGELHSHWMRQVLGIPRPTAQSLAIELGDDSRVMPWQIGHIDAGRGRPHRPIYEIVTEESRRRIAHRGTLFALITSPWRRSFEKWQADCNSGSGHLPATIKPKIVRHTIILSANYLSLVTPPTSVSGRLAKPGCHKSFDSKLSFAAWCIPHDFLFWRRAVRCILF
jgi:hypothetical protein